MQISINTFQQERAPYLFLYSLLSPIITYQRFFFYVRKFTSKKTKQKTEKSSTDCYIIVIQFFLSYCLQATVEHVSECDGSTGAGWRMGVGFASACWVRGGR